MHVLASQGERQEPSAGKPGLSKQKQDSKHEEGDHSSGAMAIVTAAAADGTPPVNAIGAGEIGEVNNPEGGNISSAEGDDNDGHDSRKPLAGRDGPQAVPDWLADPVAFVSQIVARVQEGGSAKCVRRSRAPPPPTRNFPQCVVRV